MARMVAFHWTPKDVATIDKHDFHGCVPLAKCFPKLRAAMRKYEVNQRLILMTAGEFELYLVETLHFDVRAPSFTPSQHLRGSPAQQAFGD